MKTQNEIIADLNKLASAYSFRYLLANICFRDFCGTINQMASKNVHEHLNHNEFFFLFGLWVKNVKLTHDDNKGQLKEKLDKCYKLMDELHKSFLNQTPKPDLSNPDSFREVLMDASTFRESFFYSGTGAYDFQYTKWVTEKYKYDRDWLKNNAGIDISLAPQLFNFLKGKLHERLNSRNKRSRPTDDDILELFCFDQQELFHLNEKFKSLIQRFTLKIGEAHNSGFNDVGDFNILSEKPIIELANGKLFIPQPHSLAEAMYESPFYWMNSDESYKDTALKNRGTTAEDITHKIVRNVYGSKQTFRSLKIIESKGKVITDIDVLAIFSNTAIIFQVKSKKLTAIYKKGNVESIKNDFKKAITDALNQGLKAKHQLLENENLKLVTSEGKLFSLKTKITNCEVVAITLDNYPAIANQSRLLLTNKPQDEFLVAMTIFDLEIIAKYLKTPQSFFEYFFSRRKFSSYFMSENEMGYLGFHLQHGLQKFKDADFFHLDESWAQYIDSIYYPEISGIKELEKKKIGRNEQCPCGSGKKYKKCHGGNLDLPMLA
jgi:hypothetical protein